MLQRRLIPKLILLQVISMDVLMIRFPAAVVMTVVLKMKTAVTKAMEMEMVSVMIKIP